jgi:hypothetical protein
MMKAIYILIFLFTLSLHSQKKTIIPRKGTIVFNAKDVITDQKLYDQSLNELKKGLMPILRSSVELERKNNNKSTDTVQLNVMLKMLDENFNQNFRYLLNLASKNYVYYHTFDNDEITYHIEEDSIIIGDFETINIKKIQPQKEGVPATEVTDMTSSDYFKEQGPFIYSDIDIIEIKEFRKEKRRINNFDCFKVVMSYREESQNFDQGFLGSQIEYKELWVTEKIKCPFHPVIRDQEILEKFYPLEITEYSDMIKGSTKQYKLVSLKL